VSESHGSAADVPERTPTPQDAQTLSDVVAAFERNGYGGQFRVLDGGRLQCLTCRNEYASGDATMDDLRRLEGASDPADMLAVAALRCPVCGAHGTVVLNYGPEAPLDDADVLLSFDE
jgi:hypothetical protein